MRVRGSLTATLVRRRDPRVEMLKDRGYGVTDIVDAALNEFLDRAGVPQSE